MSAARSTGQLRFPTFWGGQQLSVYWPCSRQTAADPPPKKSREAQLQGKCELARAAVVPEVFSFVEPLLRPRPFENGQKCTSTMNFPVNHCDFVALHNADFRKRAKQVPNGVVGGAPSSACSAHSQLA